MNKFVTAGIALCAALTAASAASAATVITGALGTVEAGSTLYADYDTKTPEISGGVLTVSPSTGLAGLAAPVGTGNFGYVTGGSSVSYTFGPTSVFSLDVGSIDSYNSFTLAFNDGTTQTFGNGQGIFGQFGSTDSARFIFTAGAGQLITGATLASSSNSLEFDNLAIGAVPEPTTWAMMLAGFGMVGFGLRRRSNVKTTVSYA